MLECRGQLIISGQRLQTAGQAAAFDRLVQSVQACRRCPAMEGRRRVLGPANGPLQAPVMFIAEAPGRFGAERTGVPLSGDQAGRTFEHLLACAGWTRQDVFVTNAVLCNPQDSRGRNRRPSARELANCCTYLRAQIELVAPRLIVALGATALRALDQIEPHGLRLKRDVGRAVPWLGRHLVALYHPGPRALIHRPLAEQEADFHALRVQCLCLARRELTPLAAPAPATNAPSARPGRDQPGPPPLWPEPPPAPERPAGNGTPASSRTSAG